MLEEYKRVIFYAADHGGCSYFRCEKISMHIEPYGFEYELTNVMQNDTMYWAGGNKRGIAVLQRQYGESNYENAINMKKAGIKLVFEIDDYLHKVDKTNPAYQHYKPGAPVHKMLYKFYKLCDAITVSTEPLRQNLLKYNKNIYVVPNSFIINDWNIEKPKHKTVNILWSGSPTHYCDLADTEVSNAIKEILKKYPNTKLITAGWDGGDILKDVPGYKRIHYPWTNNIREVSKFYRLADIGLAPIKETEFNRCKSSNKFVEYGLTNTAAIATRFGPYEDTIRHMEDGLLVKNRFDKWYKAIEKLVLDEGLRKYLSDNARKRCVEEYNIEKNIVNWVKVYNKVLGLPENDGIYNI